MDESNNDYEYITLNFRLSKWHYGQINPEINPEKPERADWVFLDDCSTKIRADKALTKETRVEIKDRINQLRKDVAVATTHQKIADLRSSKYYDLLMKHNIVSFQKVKNEKGDLVQKWVWLDPEDQTYIETGIRTW